MPRRGPTHLTLHFADGTSVRFFPENPTERAEARESMSIHAQLRSLPPEVVATARRQLIDEGNDERLIAGSVLLARARKVLAASEEQEAQEQAAGAGVRA